MLRLLPTMLLAALLLAGCAARDRAWVRPPALKPGDTIAFVAPAKWRDAGAVAQAKAALEERGYKVRIDQDVVSKHGYLAGPDEVRAKALMDAFEDPEIDAIFPVTGGYGTTRLLDRLDYGTIRRHPKVLIGYSDMTGLHLAIARRSRVVTFHSPFPSYFYVPGDTDKSYPRNGFWQAIEAPSYAGRTEPGYAIDTDSPTTPVTTLIPGVARGRLVGGNLSLVHAIAGTPYEIETKGNILFLEDIEEAPYRIDRMLSQLELSGKLDEPAGVVLGIFKGCDAENPEEEFTLRQVFDRYFAGRPYPVVMDFPVGHVLPNATLPVGAMAELDATKGTLRILENPVVLPPSK